MINHEEKAHELFKQGYNCAQSVFAAFCDVTGIDFETAIKLTSGFGAGMGGMRDTCGAVTGMFMVADMLYGYTDSQATTEKAAHYATIRKLAEQFKEETKASCAAIFWPSARRRSSPWSVPTRTTQSGPAPAL